MVDAKEIAQARAEGKKVAFKPLSQYVDYRTYLDYDMYVKNLSTGYEVPLSEVSGDGSGGATAGAAGNALGVPGVLGRTEGGVLGGRPHGELVHVGLADNRQPGFLDLGSDGRVVRRLPVAQDLRGAGGAQAARHDVVLQGDRHARQTVQRLPRGAARIHVGGGRQGTLTVDGDEGVDAIVDCVDTVEARLGQLDGGDLARQPACPPTPARSSSTARSSVLP